MRWHAVFETLAYFVAFRVYTWQRNRHGDTLDTSRRWTIVAAAFIGAVLGAKLLYLLEDPARTLHHWRDWAYLSGGKTILGAILGGTVAVEVVKKRLGIRQRTGDLFAIPMAVGIAIGRIGCLLAGTADDTYGVPTSMPWGIDLGDGVRRQPVQLFEIAAMIGLAVVLSKIRPPKFAQGDRYRMFIFCYMLWRVFIDFWKPEVRLFGMAVLQWAAAIAALWFGRDVVRICEKNIKAAYLTVRSAD